MVLAILKCEAYIEMPFPMQMQNGKINDVHFLQPGKFPIPCKPFNRKLTGELWLWNNRLFAMVWRLNRLLQAACNKIFALSWNIETYPPPTCSTTIIRTLFGPAPFTPPIEGHYHFRLAAVLRCSWRRRFCFLCSPHLCQFCMHFYHHPEPNTPYHPKRQTIPPHTISMPPVLSAVAYIVTVAAFLCMRSWLCSGPSSGPGLMFLHFIRIAQLHHPFQYLLYNSPAVKEFSAFV